MNTEIADIISRSKKWGWVLEPDAKKIFSLKGLKTPRYGVAASRKEAPRLAKKIGYPVVAKVVSPDVLHKSDVKGVVIGIDNDEALTGAFERLSRIRGFTGMLIEEMVHGLELIIGAKNDYQFGPMILLGIGGVGVEIYKDVSLRMAPLKDRDAAIMVKNLKAHGLLEGYRGSPPINMKSLSRLLKTFSGLVMEYKDIIESIDLNPVICTSKSCIVVDARIVLGNGAAG